MDRILLATALAAAACFVSCGSSRSETRPADSATPDSQARHDPPETPMADRNAPQSGSATPASNPSSTRELATFGAGCYWCTEAVLEQVEGVLDVTSGFMGGHVKDPTYEQVCSGTTGHAEVVQVTFDPSKISYSDLLEWFWRLHDPTTLNRQGNDVGTQYRSVIFYHSDEQKRLAEASRAKAQSSGHFSDPIVTEIVPASEFYSAEAYHQDYYRQNKRQGYCRYVIAPKLDKLGLEK